MRHRAPTVCPRRGCINDQPCPLHTAAPWATSTRRARLPANWSTLRANVLRRDGHRCQLCGAPATEVDHITPGDNHDPANLQAICTPCHRRKSATEGRAARR